MFLEAKLPKNKNINYLKDQVSKHPLLQIIYKSKKQKKPDENSCISFVPRSLEYNSFSGLNFKDKIKGENNVLPKKVEDNQSVSHKNDKNNNNSNIEERNSIDNKSNNSNRISFFIIIKKLIIKKN